MTLDQSPPSECWVCQGARTLVASPQDPAVLELSQPVTFHKLKSRIAAGQMTYVRCDVPIEEMGALVASGLVRRAAAFLKCEVCGREWLYVMGERIMPGYDEVPHGAADEWDWKPVPDEALWK